MKKILKRVLSLKPIKWVIFKYNSIWNNFHYKKVCKEADKHHKITGKRHYVLPAQDRCIVVNNDWLKAYNRQVPKNKRLNHKQMSEMAYYDTGRGDLRRVI